MTFSIHCGVICTTFLLFPSILFPANSLQIEPSSSSRRDFLGKSTASVIAGTSSPLWIPSSSSAAVEPIKLPQIGLGCWAWGDSLFWGYNPKQDGDLEEVFNFAVSKSSPVLFDTAELYGLGRSESLLGNFIKKTKEEDTILATKFAALPFRTKPESVVKACEASVKRLGRPIDLYQVSVRSFQYI